MSSPELRGSASPGAYPSPLTRCDLHEALVSVRPYMALRSTVTVVLFLRTLLSSRQGVSSSPGPRESPQFRLIARAGAWEGPFLHRIPGSLLDFVKKRGKETWLK